MQDNKCAIARDLHRQASHRRRGENSIGSQSKSKKKNKKKKAAKVENGAREVEAEQ